MPLARSRSHPSHPSHPSRSLDSLDETAARTAGRSRPYAEPNDTSRISAAERGASNCHNLSRTFRPAVMERSICTVLPARWARAGTGCGAVERLTGDPATGQTGNLSALEFYQCPTCSYSWYAVALAWARGRIGGSRCGAVPKGDPASGVLSPSFFLSFLFSGAARTDGGPPWRKAARARCMGPSQRRWRHGRWVGGAWVWRRGEPLHRERVSCSAASVLRTRGVRGWARLRLEERESAWVSGVSIDGEERRGEERRGEEREGHERDTEREWENETFAHAGPPREIGRRRRRENVSLSRNAEMERHVVYWMAGNEGVECSRGTSPSGRELWMDRLAAQPSNPLEFAERARHGKGRRWQSASSQADGHTHSIIPHDHVRRLAPLRPTRPESRAFPDRAIRRCSAETRHGMAEGRGTELHGQGQKTPAVGPWTRSFCTAGQQQQPQCRVHHVCPRRVGSGAKRAHAAEPHFSYRSLGIFRSRDDRRWRYGRPRSLDRGGEEREEENLFTAGSLSGRAIEIRRKPTNQQARWANISRIRAIESSKRTAEVRLWATS